MGAPTFAFVLTESSPRVVRTVFKRILFSTISIIYEEKYRNELIIRLASMHVIRGQ